MYLLLRVVSYLVSWSYLWFVSMSDCAWLMLCVLNPRVLFSPSLVSLPRYVVRYGLTCGVHSIPRVPCWSLDGGAFWL